MSNDDGHLMTTSEKLVRMANQIAAFFKSKPREESIAGIAEHINKFWEPQMRRQLFEMLDGGSTQFNELVVAASEKIRKPRIAEQYEALSPPSYAVGIAMHPPDREAVAPQMPQSFDYFFSRCVRLQAHPLVNANKFFQRCASNPSSPRLPSFL